MEPRNLVLVVALGRKDAASLVAHNVGVHFSRQQGWECIVFVHLADFQPAAAETLRPLCTCIHLPALNWGHYLQTVAPPLTLGYEHIALLLDDIFLPVNEFSTNLLLARMQRHGIGAASPSVVAATHNGIMSPDPPTHKRCLEETPVIEHYAVIYTQHAWSCFWRTLEPGNGGGWCYAACFASACNTTRQAIDRTMVAYHLDRLHAKAYNRSHAVKKLEMQLPAAYMQATAHRSTLTAPHVGSSGNLAYCKKHKCPAVATVEPKYFAWRNHQKSQSSSSGSTPRVSWSTRRVHSEAHNSTSWTRFECD